MPDVEEFELPPSLRVASVWLLVVGIVMIVAAASYLSYFRFGASTYTDCDIVLRAMLVFLGIASLLQLVPALLLVVAWKRPRGFHVSPTSIEVASLLCMFFLSVGLLYTGWLTLSRSEDCEGIILSLVSFIALVCFAPPLILLMAGVLRVHNRL